MEIGNQIKQHRTHMNLSQEELSKRVYVSRQTISNWETNRTYPDIHSLLLLSAIFDVTIDDLLKGDINTMKEKSRNVQKLKVLSSIMTVLMVVGMLLVAPSMDIWGNIGIVLPLVIFLIASVVSIVIERFKQQNNIQTYSEIVSFMNGTPLDESRVAYEKQHLIRSKILMALASAAIAATLGIIGVLVFG
jgi:DNA-binding XRE family transcriptional regulator